MNGRGTQVSNRKLIRKLERNKKPGEMSAFQQDESRKERLMHGSWRLANPHPKSTNSIEFHEPDVSQRPEEMSETDPLHLG